MATMTKGEKISIAKQRRKAELGYINSPETREKMRQAKTGLRAEQTNHFKKPHSEESKTKMRDARATQEPAFRGHEHSAETKQRISEQRSDQYLGDINHKWKGDEVGYSALHSWIRRTLGQPDTCVACNTSGLSGKQIHWANKSWEYKRELNDWLRLCVRCHQAYDHGNLSLAEIEGRSQ